MSRSSDARHPYVRSTRSIVQRAADGLLDAAGRARSIDRPEVEKLEPRKLLFSVTVDAASDTDGDGIGQADAVFGYFIPYLLTDIEHVAVGHVADVLIVQVFLDELGIISLRLDVGQQVGDEVAEDRVGL
ncbi:MAG: hypothetical protein AAFR96_12705, partial [Planctomycetota bacterium]